MERIQLFIIFLGLLGSILGPRLPVAASDIKSSLESNKDELREHQNLLNALDEVADILQTPHGSGDQNDQVSMESLENEDDRPCRDAKDVNCVMTLDMSEFKNEEGLPLDELESSFIILDPPLEENAEHLSEMADFEPVELNSFDSDPSSVFGTNHKFAADWDDWDDIPETESTASITDSEWLRILKSHGIDPSRTAENSHEIGTDWDYPLAPFTESTIEASRLAEFSSNDAFSIDTAVRHLTNVPFTTSTIVATRVTENGQQASIINGVTSSASRILTSATPLPETTESSSGASKVANDVVLPKVTGSLVLPKASGAFGLFKSFPVKVRVIPIKVAVPHNYNVKMTPWGGLVIYKKPEKTEETSIFRRLINFLG